MTIKEMKEQEFAYLKSGRETMRQYALAYRDIIDIFNKNSNPFMSDEMLISDSAKEYVKKIEFEYKLNEDPNLKLRAKAAADLFIHKYATKEEVKEVLGNRYIEDIDHARRILSKHPIFTKVRPETVVEILGEV